ncbi:unnamed protein product [Caenorhabditis auriculariae]|uniref:Uncharacterized protein n=1 Tax=Caenorhabditis auriculariae TaxID=2777116 RepID=A0A8S1HLK0_9PELO|nr:unnamed protein product [Caenorhabditis auriculariae]
MPKADAEASISRKSSMTSIAAMATSYMSTETCRVCGDGNAKTHYGVVTCFGCKGFFRRTLKRPTEYQCRHNGTCVVDRHERNSCRYCRFKRCIEVGMDPKAVRPDRDATGRHYQGRQRRSKLSTEDEGEVDAEWMRKLPVDMRTTLMQLLNIDLIVGGGDAHTDPTTLYPLPFTSIRQLLEDPSLLDGKRVEMRYEALREVLPDEMPVIAHRRLIAIIDWTDHVFDMMDVHNMDDKLLMVKNAFAPLTVFSFCANTARSTKRRDIVSMNTFGFIGRYTANAWNEPYHFANHLAERCIDELIEPLRKMSLKEEEVTLLKAIIVLNPFVKNMSSDTSEAIMDLRDRIQETLYHVVRETHPKEVASSRFGNLLLFVPAVMMLGKLIIENLTFVDSFGNMVDRLMHDLLDDSPTASTSSPNDSNGVHNVEMNGSEPQSPKMSRRLSDPKMVHSSSSSSVESLNSFPCTSNSYQNNVGSLPYNLSCNSLPSQMTQFDVALNGASSMPNLELQDCDPDYNMTITPDMYSDMRQAMTAAHTVDGNEIEQKTHSQGEFAKLARRDSVPASPTQTPMFYISTVETGTKHKFTVTTTSFDNGYATPNGQMNGHGNVQQQPPQQPQQFMNMQQGNPNGYGINMQPPQQPQTLCKTTSLPPQYMQQQQQQQQQYDANFAPMEAWVELLATSTQPNGKENTNCRPRIFSSFGVVRAGGGMVAVKPQIIQHWTNKNVSGPMWVSPIIFCLSRNDRQVNKTKKAPWNNNGSINGSGVGWPAFVLFSGCLRRFSPVIVDTQTTPRPDGLFGLIFAYSARIIFGLARQRVIAQIEQNGRKGNFEECLCEGRPVSLSDPGDFPSPAVERPQAKMAGPA